MRIIVIVFSLVFIVGMTISLMSNKIKEKGAVFNGGITSVKITNWKKSEDGFIFKLNVIKKDNLGEIKNLECKKFDENKEEVGKFTKKMSITKSAIKVVKVKSDNTKTKYLDCSIR